ncbi:hypothetical protein BGZ99_009369 [Dissophora globulifera]|uniref:Uncharacterized protein n=1 Tax=Dissophora globulifera TaxID=979702 RepID=A0A9P6R4P7_9FUNG|nr:hypothetical protein BGZ99_009369 [Dissophora globulifera]
MFFHNACTPFLWRTISLVGNRASRVWHKDKGFRLGLIHYGPYVHTLRLKDTRVQSGDMELIAINCTRLKYLNLSSTDVTIETLKVLLRSDPYKTSSTSTDKPEDSNSVNANIHTEKYNNTMQTGMVNDQDDLSHLYESVNLSASSKDSDQGQRHHQHKGPFLTPGPRYTSNRAMLITPGCKTISQDGAMRPTKMKEIKPQFPIHLERLSFSNCRYLSGPTLFPVLALLGPQLRDLSVGYIADIEDLSDFIQMLQHCPNLTRLSLAGTDADGYLIALAGATKELAPRAMEVLRLSLAEASVERLVPLIKVSRNKLEQLSCPDNADINDDVIYAFIESGMKLNKISRPVRSFVRNDVLSSLALNRDANITPKALLELFRHTTALTMVEVNGVDIRDDALEALAAANRNRMERLGLGIPEAWIQHEQGVFKLLANYPKQEKGAKQPAVSASPAERKRYDGAWISGGLNGLSLRDCINVTNRGIRAIVRSCPMLWGLNLSGCKSVSMQIFRGPWVCNKLQDLDISGINVRIQIRNEAMLVEEEIEDERFPMTPLCKTHPSEDIRDDGRYDFITLPTETSDYSELGDMEFIRNDGETRRTLNEFYRKLGQFDELIHLGMSKSDYRIRLKDGLDLVLPALSQNLQEWEISRHTGHTLQNVEIEWFGKHFGYGFDYSTDKDELKRQRKIKEEYQRSYDADGFEKVNGSSDEEEDENVYDFYDGDEHEEWNKDPNRVSRLEVLQLNKCLFDQSNLDRKLYDWFMKSGFDVRLVDDIDEMSDDETSDDDSDG